MHLADQAEFSKNIEKTSVFLRFLHVLLHLRKLGPGWLMLAHAGPSGPQVGTKWTPSWPKLAPSWPWNDVLGRLGRQVGFGTTPSCPWNDVLGQNGLLKSLRARSPLPKFLYRFFFWFSHKIQTLKHTKDKKTYSVNDVAAVNVDAATMRRRAIEIDLVGLRSKTETYRKQNSMETYRKLNGKVSEASF